MRGGLGKLANLLSTFRMNMFCQNCPTLGLTGMIHHHPWPSQEKQALCGMFSVAESNPNEDTSWRDKPFSEEDSGWCNIAISMYLTWGGVKNRTFIFNF